MTVASPPRALRTLQAAVQMGYRLPRRLRVDRRPGAYYVSMVDGPRVGLLLGPFRLHRQALRFVRAARQEANRRDPWAVFYGFGTLRLESGARTGSLNAALGIVPGAPRQAGRTEAC